MMRDLLQRTRKWLQPNEVSLLEEACAMGFPKHKITVTAAQQQVSSRLWAETLICRPPLSVGVAQRVVRAAEDKNSTLTLNVEPAVVAAAGTA